MISFTFHLYEFKRYAHSYHSKTGLGLWTRTLDSVRSARLKARKKSSKKSSKGKSLLSKKEPSSGSRESAAVHYSDNDPAVGRTVETLVVVGNAEPAQGQEKEARSVGGIPSR